MTFEALFLKGGIVVWILAGYSVLGLAIVLERYLHWLRMGRTPADLEERIQASLQNNDPQSFGIMKGPEAAVVTGMLDSLGRGAQDPEPTGIRIRAEELKRMESGLATLGILGNTAPLLGLLGTIVGMIKAFMVIEQAGGKVDAAALAGGIWEAMITTGVGLTVAIPLLILLHFLENAVEHRLHSMDRCISLVSEHFSAHGHKPDRARPHHWENLSDTV
jgi:biopolymer transport protein ExbB